MGSNEHGQESTRPLKSFDELIRDGRALSQYNTFLLAKKALLSSLPPTTPEEAVALQTAEHLASYYHRSEPTPAQLEAAYHASLIGGRIGKMLLSAQFEDTLPDALATPPNQLMLIPDKIPAVFDSFGSYDRKYLVDAIIHNLGLRKSKHADLGAVTVGLELYGYENYGRDYTRNQALVKAQIETERFREIVNQLPDLGDFKFPDET